MATNFNNPLYSLKTAILEEKELRLKKIISGCVKWDRNSQKLLYQEFYSYGMSICLRYSDSRDEAADIYNQAFLKVFQSIDKFNSTLPFKPWFRQIVINTTINHYHKKQKQIKIEELEKASNHPDSEHIISGIAYEELLGFLYQISPACRTVFNLHVIEGYSHDEIAKLLKISSGTSKSNLFKAKEQLRNLLTNFFTDNSYVSA